MMKKNVFLLLVAWLSLMVVGCSDNDEFTEDNGVLNNIDQYYMSVNIQVPTAKSSRSKTNNEGGGSTDGKEDGQPFENKVKNVTLVLAEPADAASNPLNVLATGYVATGIVGAGTTYTVPISKKQVTDLLGDKNEKTVSVWVLCNAGEPDENLTLNNQQTINNKEDFDNKIASTGNSNFLMSNVEYKKVTLEKSEFSQNPLNPYNIGDVKVERAVARFDYKIKEENGTNDAKKTFDLVGSGNDPKVTVTLQSAALVNVNKQFYLFRRVSDDGLLKNNEEDHYTIGGTETNKNYVVDAIADWKNQYYNAIANQGDNLANQGKDLENARKGNFLFDCTSAISGLNFVNIPSTRSGANDNDKGTIQGSDYARLFYCSENTIPAYNGVNQNQINGLTTGVVFKAQIKAENYTKVEDIEAKYGVNINAPAAVDADKYIYVFNNILYGTWDKVKANAESGSNSALKAAVDYVQAAVKSISENKDAAIAEAAVAVDFTVYKAENYGSSQYGYFTYYYYWNRHNDNENPKKMGPMEYAVVRNNVYKLSVTNITKFGHPDDKGKDPDPIDPKTPDEKDDYYFQVSVEVQPWVVRKNEIQF